MSNCISDNKQNPKKEEVPLMYIRQTTLFSFEEIMEFQQETKLELILSEIDVSALAQVLSKPAGTRGANGYRIAPLIYSALAKQILRIEKTSELIRQLKENPVLRYNCGFEVLSKVPSASTFSRFFRKLAQTDALKNLFEKLVIEASNLGIIDDEHVSIDATKVDAYEASKPKKDIIDDGNHPNWGMKRDTHGNNIRWFGWKLHILSDSKSELPLSIMVTPANIHDGNIAIPLVKVLKEDYNQFFRPKYYAMNSGYDYKNIYVSIINDFEDVPIIAYNPRESYSPPDSLDKEMHPICSASYKLVH